MRKLLASALLVGLTTAAIQADDTATAKTSPNPAFVALKKEFDDAQKDWQKVAMEKRTAAQKAMKDATTDEEKKEAQKLMSTAMPEHPGAKFAPRFLEWAQKNAQDASTIDAVNMALMYGRAPAAKETWTKAVALCQKNYVNKPEIKKCLRVLASANDEAAEKLVKEVATKNPDRKCQAVAYKALASARENAAQMATRIAGNDRMREAYEKSMGKEKVEKMIADGDKAKKEAEEFTTLVKEKYSDIFPDLSVGKAAPEVVILDVDGKEAKLSALKGRVVVLDIWATWCGPCRAMIPHEREMTERLKDKPFTLVSVSADAEKKTLTDFLAKEKMPWTHWWNGNEGGMTEEWDVQYFPTIYVIDAKGIIRHKDLRGEELEKAVNELLEKSDSK